MPVDTQLQDRQTIAKEDSIMRYLISAILTLGLVVTATPVIAQGRGNGHANQPASTSHGSQASQPSNQGGSQAGTHGNPHTTTTASNTTTSGTTTGTTSGTTSGTGTSTGTTPITETTPTSKHPNSALATRLKPMLPANMSVDEAAKGFKNWGQFVAAVHVANNLNISFVDLKAKMTGTSPMSLGQAIQSLPRTGTTSTTTTGSTSTPGSTTSTTTPTTTTAVQTQVKKAESEAADDLRAASNDKRR